MRNGAAVLASGEEFAPPGPADFDLPAIFGDAEAATLLGMETWSGVTKPMIQLVVAAVLVFVFFKMAIGKQAMVPGRLQFAGESAYSFVRNSLGRDIIGSRDFMTYVPYLFALFFFILINNFFGAIPAIQFPTFSRSGMVYALAGLSWVIYNVAGMRVHGVLGYLKHQSVPPGVTGPILLLLVPLEFMSNILVRPVTLALRLFANMFAGHLLLILFAVGGEYLLIEGALAIKPVGLLAWAMFIAISFLELLIQFLQAYVFVLLNAMYISSAISEEH